jgi:MFS transporter, OPA family, glycerol-3-phosphate transporter
MSQSTTPTRVLRSTGLHYWQLIAFFAAGCLYLTCYFARYNLGPATSEIIDELGYTKKQLGWITTSFTVYYAAGQFINGWLADRFGPRRLLIVGGVGCVAANVCFAVSDSFLAFVASWAMNGYFSSMLWSPSCRIVYNWFPRNRWGFWKGALLTMSFAGGALGLPLAARVISAYGWRAAFLIPPAFLLGTTVVFFFLGRNSPRDAGFQPQWEEAVEPGEPERKIGVADYLAALSNFKMNLAYLAGAGEKMVRIGIITWFVPILKEPVEKGGFGLPLEQSSLMTSLAFWGGVALSIPCGVITDRVFRGQRWQTMVIGFLISAAGLACLARVDFILNSPYRLWLIGAAIFVCGGMIQAMETPLYVLPGQILGKERGATGVGIMGGCMYIGASLSGVFLGWWLDHYSVSSMLILLAYVCVFSSLVSATIRR